MENLENTCEDVRDAVEAAEAMAAGMRHEFITPEHLLAAISVQIPFTFAVKDSGVPALMQEYLREYVPEVPENAEYDVPVPSVQMQQLWHLAFLQTLSAGRSRMEMTHLLAAFFNLKNSYAADVLEAVADYDKGEFMIRIIDAYDDIPHSGDEEENYLPLLSEDDEPGSVDAAWTELLTCLNEHVDSHNPLIGREKELERTIQVLCRKDKNNPLHVGEAGVGKTAIAYGLAAMIESGRVPKRLEGCKLYAMDLGTLMAGTQYRGDLEQRLKKILDGASAQGNAIIYIDEIHNIVGAGRVGDGAFDVSNMLKQYLEKGDIRFMGATTYEEYNKSFLKSRALARRFEKIDVAEPSLDECREILFGLKERYEKFHLVTYTDEAIEFAVKASDKYISHRFLPDKAIDLIDDAGAWRQTHPIEDSAQQIVDKDLVCRVLSRICNVDILAENTGRTEQLVGLEENILKSVFGQPEAVHQVAEAVLMGNAGLVDDNKPLASLLFVGQTGVGKTELAKVLASLTGVPLLRFDMSEYAERHTVAKLIGAPAGYVGYDDGGLLTDAVSKSPHCVLLFDELEKAHPDIYNILLQVMDYASLTDSKGRKVDFRHVVFIMTTNAGAQYAHLDGMGFVRSRTAGEAMMKSVKQTFKPEFLNRLTAITVFNDIDRDMAGLILDKKIGALQALAASKNVTFTVTAKAREVLLDKGYSVQYGGREIERVVNKELKPLLMRQILFGKLRDGGEAQFDAGAEGTIVMN